MKESKYFGAVVVQISLNNAAFMSIYILEGDGCTKYLNKHVSLLYINTQNSNKIRRHTNTFFREKQLRVSILGNSFLLTLFINILKIKFRLNFYVY